MIGTDTMLTLMPRRKALTLFGAGCAAILTSRFSPVLAQDSNDAAFVRHLSDELIRIINGPGSLADKRQQILPLIDQNVDVDGIGRFCLGRFWHLATPDQQQRFLKLFHHVLLNSITDKLGEYKGVRVDVGASTPRGPGETAVSTTIDRPGQPQTNVQWVIAQVGGRPKVADVIGEGVSLSLTQRGDYSSYLQRNNNNIDALLAAMQRQVTRAS
jgi:phospholipid transport system substrate-binding protein